MNYLELVWRLRAGEDPAELFAATLATYPGSTGVAMFCAAADYAGVPLTDLEIPTEPEPEGER